MDEIPVDKRWEDLILSTRTRDDIQKAAEKGCRKSQIELAHLDRNKFNKDDPRAKPDA